MFSDIKDGCKRYYTVSHVSFSLIVFLEAVFQFPIVFLEAVFQFLQ